MGSANFVNQSEPLVSVVIPTRNRGELLARAVRSVLAQTWTRLEIFVVIDGPDPETLRLLTGFTDPRLEIIALDESVGGAEARNVGARAARGEWVALLDDDDEWLPAKLSMQLAAVAGRHSNEYFVGSRYVERSPDGDRILPLDTAWEGDASEALFCRRTLRSGTAYVQTSTWLISRSLLLRVPFTKGLRRNQDADWMLHALGERGVSVIILPEPLTIFYEHKQAGRISKKADWRFHYEWALANQAYFTSRAMAFFLLTACVHDAAAMGEPLSVRWFLLRESFRLGAPTSVALLFFVYYGLIPGLLGRARASQTRPTVAVNAPVAP